MSRDCWWTGLKYQWIGLYLAERKSSFFLPENVLFCWILKPCFEDRILCDKAGGMWEASLVNWGGRDYDKTSLSTQQIAMSVCQLSQKPPEIGSPQVTVSQSPAAFVPQSLCRPRTILSTATDNLHCLRRDIILFTSFKLCMKRTTGSRDFEYAPLLVFSLLGCGVFTI